MTASVPVSNSSVSRRGTSPSGPGQLEKRSIHPATMSSITIDPELKPGEFCHQEPLRRVCCACREEDRGGHG